MSSTVARLAVDERESNASVVSEDGRVNLQPFSWLYHDAVFLPVQIIIRFQFTTRPSVLAYFHTDCKLTASLRAYSGFHIMMRHGGDVRSSLIFLGPTAVQLYRHPITSVTHERDEQTFMANNIERVPGHQGIASRHQAHPP
jgi:hypothetical protein